MLHFLWEESDFLHSLVFNLFRELQHSTAHSATPVHHIHVIPSGRPIRRCYRAASEPVAATVASTHLPKKEETTKLKSRMTANCTSRKTTQNKITQVTHTWLTHLVSTALTPRPLNLPQRFNTSETDLHICLAMTCCSVTNQYLRHRTMYIVHKRWIGPSIIIDHIWRHLLHKLQCHVQNKNQKDVALCSQSNHNPHAWIQIWSTGAFSKWSTLILNANKSAT